MGLTKENGSFPKRNLNHETRWADVWKSHATVLSGTNCLGSSRCCSVGRGQFTHHALFLERKHNSDCGWPIWASTPFPKAFLSSGCPGSVFRRSILHPNGLRQLSETAEASEEQSD